MKNIKTPLSKAKAIISNPKCNSGSVNSLMILNIFLIGFNKLFSSIKSFSTYCAGYNAKIFEVNK